jgi:uncharacterized protein
MIPRTLAGKIQELSAKLPIISLTGPRQSGKTTLLKNLFPKFKYVSLEDPDRRILAQDDPRGFLSTFAPPVIIDEAQQVPELFSYIQTLSDNLNKPGQFILSGSQNFLLLEKISQSLAGRTAVLNLLPLGINELQKAKLLPDHIDTLLFRGCYPRVWDKNLEPQDWYPSYIQTYLEKDIRQIKEITNLSLFQKFLGLCAGRVGQILNLSSLAIDAGVTHNTIRSWISLLEASFIIFLLKPYYGNFNKRLIKSPKIYFYDTGLACSLLGIQSENQIATHPLRGSLFENFIVSQLRTYQYHHGQIPRDYFFRDKQGKEVDYLCQTPEKMLSIEIKAGQTVTSQYFSNLEYWQNLSGSSPKNSFVIFAGDEKQTRKQATIVPWKNALEIIE